MKRPLQSLTVAIVGSGLVALVLAGVASAARGSQAAPPSPARAPIVAYIASVEGVTPTVLKQELKAGKTLLQIAGGKYSSAGDLATALLAPVKTRLDAAVKTKRLTAAQETAVYTPLRARMTQLVVTPHPLRSVGAALKKATGGRASAVQSDLVSIVARTCGTTPAALQKAFQAGGKTPLQICQATKPSVTQNGLVSALVGGARTRLDAAAKALGLSPQQEGQILAQIRARLNTWVVTPIAPTSL